MTPNTHIQPADTSTLGELSDQDFAAIKEFALTRAGLQIQDAKRLMVQSRLARRLRATGSASFSEYIQWISQEKSADEHGALISALTTNVTSFFRENHHFETLAARVLRNLIENARQGNRVRLWSAGCSSGEEPYSLAMLISHLEPTAHELDIKILATDIDRAILSKARAGIYRTESLQRLPFGIQRGGGFETLTDDRSSAPKHLRDLISFRHLNLHDDWPIATTFDVIMCRNVVIYFDAEHQAALWPRFFKSLRRDGWLFLGHSERIHPLPGSGFSAEGLTTYRKADAEISTAQRGKSNDIA